MSCRFSENDIALYVEGDLPPAKADEIEQHLGLCVGCRDLAGDLRESQAIFKNLKQDTVSVAALSSVRARVLAEISGAGVKRAWGRWIYAMAGLSFAAIVCVGLALYLQEPPVPPVLQVIKTDIPLLAKEGWREAPGWSLTPKISARATTPSAPSAQPPLLRKEGNTARAETPAEPAEPAKPLVVKLLTDDPNIVIYWLIDQNTGGSL